MVQLGRRLRGDPPLPATPPPEVPGSILADLAECGLATLATPRRVLLPRTARAGFHEAGSLPRSVLEPGVTLHVGYSVKTNPHPALLALALEQGLLAEAITGAEFRHALGCGFRPRQIVLNGPAQGWPEEAPAGEAPFAIFADSLERLEALGAAGVHARFLGPRLRTVPIASRFGIDAGEFGEFSALSGLLARHPGPALGLHFHMASDVLGVPPWRELYAAALRWGCALEVASGRPVRCLDIGGGWFPDDFFQVLVPALPGMLHEAKRLLPRLESFVLEPGKALAQPAMALVTRVLEVRRRHGRAEAVVDGAISDLPQAFHYPHRLLAACRGGPPVPLAGGKGRVLGRNCMEFDGLATEVELPPELAPGDRLVFCDAGAYDATMAYAFGTGRLKDA
jgi:diaminopimelate decarboxylase